MRFYAALLAALVMLTATGVAQAEVKTEVIEYDAAGKTMKGFLAYDASLTGKRPGVVVFHEWWGLNDYAKHRAEMLAKLGYVAFCADLYGDGKVAEHPEDAGKMAGAVRMNQETWLARGRAAVKTLADRPEVDPTKIAAIGYCFGGTTALQLALAGEDLKAVGAFHAGIPAGVTAEKAKEVKAKVLLAQGGADAFIPAKVNAEFTKVLTDNGVSVQLEEYPGATHGYTVEGVEQKMPALKYDASADKKSWAALQELLSTTLK
ncbi:MAG TPA: dienelactone hydrolase family protein [Pirellulales bacterium]